MTWWKCEPEINRNGDLLWQQESCDRIEWTLPEQLNVPGDIDHEALDIIQQRITNTSFDEIPTMDEMARAIADLKDGKAPGGDVITAEVWNTKETICSADCTN